MWSGPPQPRPNPWRRVILTRVEHPPAVSTSDLAHQRAANALPRLAPAK